MELKPVYLICGSDWPKVDAAMARLRARFPEESIEQISIGDEGVDVVAACNALDLLGGPRLVLVRGVDTLSEPEAEAIATYLDSPTPETCLALFGGAGLDPKSVLVRAVDAAGESRFFDAPDRKQAADWVVKRFGSEGVTCSLPVARRLVELVGEDMGDLAPEVEKLVVFARGEAPEVEDVEALVPPQIEIKPWEITDAWGRRDSASMIALAVADIDAPGDVSRVVAQLSAHVRKVWRAASLLERGATQGDVAKELGMKPYPAQKLVAQAQRFGAAELGGAIVRLSQLDLAVKGGSRLNARFELELALAEIATE
jgi:DNA polymerase-3 subunit delta